MTEKLDKLPPLHVEIPADAYGIESTFVQDAKPADIKMALIAFDMCVIAVKRKSSKIENAYPAHIGGTENFFMLHSLAHRCGVELQFPLARKNI